MKSKVLIAIAVASLSIPLLVYANHNTSFGSIDVIDHVFPSGGGSYPGTLLGGGDDGYIVFAGQAGDVITIDYRGNSSGGGTMGDPFVVLTVEAENGCAEVGDAINVTNFNINQVGNGTDLIVLAYNDDGGAGVDSRIANFVLPSSGQYVIGAGSFNDGSAGTYTMELSGNTADVACEDFSKEIVSGPDWGGEEGVPGPDGEIDLAVEVGIETPTMYDFRINYLQPGLPDVQIEDTVPAEWDVTDLLDATMDCEYGGANGKNNGKSATKLVCWPDSGTGAGEVTVWAEARCHGNNNNAKCRPTSCGALYLNDGAEAFELDPATGEPVVDEVTGERLPPLVTSNSLCLAAVEDLNGNGIDYRGLGDEDGDSLTDLEEACTIGTDPCLEDTDGDGVNDDVDECPLEGPPDASTGELQDSNGCNRQSQCSDTLDNDDDVAVDYPADLSCDSLLDDTEDTADCPCFSSTDIQNGGAVANCGSNYPGFPDLAGMNFTDGGVACSGSNCAGSAPQDCAISTVATGFIVSAVNAGQDSACRAIIMANCANPNSPLTNAPVSANPFID